jgi:hypothetical protein
MAGAPLCVQRGLRIYPVQLPRLYHNGAHVYHNGANSRIALYDLNGAGTNHARIDHKG